MDRDKQFQKKVERYYRFMPSMYRPGINPFITSCLKALARSDADININIDEAGKQIFQQTAEGKYLDSLGANVGVDRPVSINLSDKKFRDLIPILSYKPKQIKKTIYELLDVFWGPLYSRANITALAYEPYNLGKINQMTGTVTFQKNNYKVVGSGTSFTTQLSIGDYVKVESQDNQYFKRISKINSDTELFLAERYEGASSTGNGSYYTPLNIKIIIDAGKEKSIIIKPNDINDTENATALEIANAINNSIPDTATSETITASVIIDYTQELNYLNMRTDTPGTSGSIEITGGTANIFSEGVLNFNGNYVYTTNEEASLYSVGDDVVVGSNIGSIESSIISISSDTPSTGISRIEVSDNVSAYIEAENNFIYYKGHFGLSNGERLISNLQQNTAIYETTNRELTVSIPSTVPALRRTLKGSAHIRTNWSGEIVSIDNGNKQIIINFDMDSVLENQHEGRDFASNLVRIPIVSHSSGKDGVILQFGSTEDLSNINTDDGFVIMDDDFISSYVYDPQNATFSVTSKRCVLNQNISNGFIYPSISVEGAGDIPNESGYLIFNFGRTGEEQPILYRGRPNNSTLLLDPSYEFVNNHESGEIINVISPDLKAAVPSKDGDDYATYITGIEDALEIVKNLVTQIKAAGITINFIIKTPEYLWETARDE